MPKEIIKTIEYAYVKDIVLLPNIEHKEEVEVGLDDNGAPVRAEIMRYKNRISITYDLKGDNFADTAHKEHFSDVTEAMQTYNEYKQWQADNEANFIAADKLELAGYEV